MELIEKEWIIKLLDGLDEDFQKNEEFSKYEKGIASAVVHSIKLGISLAPTYKIVGNSINQADMQ